MKNLIHMIRTLFKIARLSSVDDSGNFQQGIFAYMGSNPKGQIFIPYGVLMNPPIGCQVAVLSQNGNESNAIGFASDPKNRILKNLQPGEYGIANYLTGSYIIFKSNGNIEISSESDIEVTKCTNLNILASGAANITIPNIIITGNMAINGNLVTNGNLVNNGITFGTHIHSQGNDSNGDAEVDTGGPHS